MGGMRPRASGVAACLRMACAALMGFFTPSGGSWVMVDRINCER